MKRTPLLEKKSFRRLGAGALMGAILFWPLIGVGESLDGGEIEEARLAGSANFMGKRGLERFLNAPGIGADCDADYEAALDEIRKIVGREPASNERLETLVGLLQEAAKSEQDTGFCTVLAGQLQDVLSVRRVNSESERRYGDLEKDRERLSRNATIVAQSNPVGDFAGKDAEALTERELGRQAKRERELMPIAEELARNEAERREIRIRQGVLEQKAKVEFQKLAAFFFTRRRFEHVCLASRMYRWVFSTTDMRFLDAELESNFSRPGALPSTLGTLDSISIQMIEKARQGAEGFRMSLQRKELQSAAESLCEGFQAGGHLPGMRSLSRDDKRMVLRYLQMSSRLEGLIQTKNFGEAQKLVAALREMSADFAGLHEGAAIEKAILFSNFAFARFRLNSSRSKEGLGGTDDIAEAMSFWPMNPDLRQYLGLQSETRTRSFPREPQREQKP